MNGDERLTTDYASTGSGDCSYAIDDVARFRANIYKENSRRAVVRRNLQSWVLTLATLSLPPIFSRDHQGEKWDRPRDGRGWKR